MVRVVFVVVVVVVFVVVVVVVVVFVVFALFIDLLTDQVQPLSRCVVRRPRVEGAGQNSTPPRTAWGGAPPGTTNALSSAVCNVLFILSYVSHVFCFFCWFNYHPRI